MAMILSITTDRKQGGIATALQSYSQALGQRGHHHTILLPSDSVAIGGLARIRTVTLITMPAALIRFHLMTRAIFSPQLRRAFADADALFLHNARLAAPARAFNRPVVLFSHSGKLRHIKNADHAVFLSHAAAGRAGDHLSAATVSDHDKAPVIHVIPHGFPAHPAIRRESGPATPLRVVAAGRFVQKKGFSVLIDAARLLHRRGIAVQIALYGDGPRAPALARQAGDAGLTNLALHGWHDDLGSVFDNSDMFCLPSHDEPFGLVIGEAMGRGLPMVATMTDGPLDVLGHAGLTADSTLGAGGLLVATGDAGAMADAITFFATNRAALQAAGMAAHQRIAKDFGMAALADRLEGLISAAASRQSAAPS
jgi:glycosyltransferase involved in cell wall biosynthesis